jgi:hypothetical protein
VTNYANFAVDTNFASSITDSETSKSVDAATDWPPAPFKIVCETEVIYVGTRSGTSLSDMIRGYEGTTKAAHTTTPTVSHKGTSGDLGGVPQWMSDLAARPGEPHAYDDEFDDESIHGDWTELDITGTTTWTESGGKLSVLADNQTANDFGVQLKALDSLTSPLTIDTVRVSSAPVGMNAMSGILFSDGVISSSKAWANMAYFPSNAGWERTTIQARTGTLTNMGTASGSVQHQNPISQLYLRLVWSAANTFKVLWSPDGISYVSHSTASHANTMTPTHFGLFASTWGTNAEMVASFDYFRVTESDLS